MIKCLVFDLGGVVVSDEVRDYIHTNAANYFGVSPEDVKRALVRHEETLQLPGWNEKRYWQNVAADLGVAVPSNPPKFWTEKYEETTPPIKEVVELLKLLRAKGYKLAVLSNTVQEHVDVNRKRGLFELFDVETFSCDPKVNSVKPDKGIYEDCLEKIGLPAGQCVFIDNKEENLGPAKKMGMEAILFESPEQLKSELAKLGVEF